MVDETPVECLKAHMTKVINSMKPNERDILYRQVLEIIDAKRFDDMVEGHGQALACPKCGATASSDTERRQRGRNAISAGIVERFMPISNAER